MRAKRDGQPIPGTARTITADEQNAALGIDKPTPAPAPLPLTPAQARRAMSGEWVGDDLDPPDFERSVVSDPDEVAAVLGLRPDDFDSAPLGSMLEGQPVPAPAFRPKLKPRDEGATTKTSPPLDVAAKAELAADWHAHAQKVGEVAASAKQSGDAAREAKAAAAVRASAEVGEALKARGIL